MKGMHDNGKPSLGGGKAALRRADEKGSGGRSRAFCRKSLHCRLSASDEGRRPDRHPSCSPAKSPYSGSEARVQLHLQAIRLNPEQVQVETACECQTEAAGRSQGGYPARLGMA